MKIGYDAKRAFLNITGLGNYSRGIIKGMAAGYPKNEYFLYTPVVVPGIRAEFVKNLRGVRVVTPRRQILAALWRSKFVITDLKIAGVQLYHGLSHEIPLGINKTGIKSVVTIHDLIFKRFPKYFGAISRMIYDAKVKYACNHADKIVAISRRTKMDLIELLGVDENKIEVIYQNCDDNFRVEPTAIKMGETKLKYNLPNRFVLYIGTIEERKNLFLLIKAIKLLPNDVRVAVVGKETMYVNEIKKYIARNQLGGRVLFIPNASFSDLPAIYRLAEIFVYPSRYEGFGIPVLEALVSGTPVIAATGSCLEEAGGPDSLYVDPDDEADLAEKLKTLWGDKQTQKTMAEKGRLYARQFETKRLTAQMMQLYQNVIGHAE